MNNDTQNLNTTSGMQDADLTTTTSTMGQGATNLSSTQGTQGYTTNASGEVVVPEYQEELVPETVERQEGMVHVHKDVVQEQQTVSAPVTHEEVDVERVPVHQPVGSAPPDAFQEQDLNIPLRGEELVAGKQVVEAEEVHLRKHQVQEQEQVSGTVRREEVEVDQPTQATATTGTIDTMSTAQTTPMQATTTTDTLSTGMTGTTLQGSDAFAQPAQGATTESTTYRIEAEPVQQTMGQVGGAAGTMGGTTAGTVQGTAQQAGSDVQGGAQQAGDKLQQGASDAKGKLDNVIDSTVNKIFGHNQ